MKSTESCSPIIRVITHRFLSKFTLNFHDIKRYTYLPNSKRLIADFSASKSKMAEWFAMNFKNNLYDKTAAIALPGF